MILFRASGVVWRRKPHRLLTRRRAEGARLLRRPRPRDPAAAGRSRLATDRGRRPMQCCSSLSMSELLRPRIPAESDSPSAGSMLRRTRCWPPRSSDTTSLVQPGAQLADTCAESDLWDTTYLYGLRGANMVLDCLTRNGLRPPCAELDAGGHNACLASSPRSCAGHMLSARTERRGSRFGASSPSAGRAAVEGRGSAAPLNDELS